MPILPILNWKQSYKDIFYGKYDATSQPFLWAKWVHANTKSMQSLPYTSSVSILEQSFPPVTLAAGTPDIAAEFISQAWFVYVCSGIWVPMLPPIPPFLSVVNAVMNPSLVSVARLTLKVSLLLEMTNLASGEAALEMKALNMATAFYTASISTGLLINGMSLVIPSVPIVVPGIIT